MPDRRRSKNEKSASGHEQSVNSRPEKGQELYTPEELEAMRELARERRGRASGKTDGEADVLRKIAAMPEPDRNIAERIHRLLKTVAPQLTPRTWYGMPAYAKDGKVLCYFQSSAQFKSRYATFGFTDKASLDSGSMWPVAFALKSFGPTEEKKIATLIKKQFASRS